MSLLSRIPNPATLDLRLYESPQEYFYRCDTDVRTCYRKSQKLHYSVKNHISLNQEMILQIYFLWISLDKRQNRPINLNYEMLSGETKQITPTKWPVEEYNDNYLMFIMENHPVNEYTMEFVKEEIQFLAYLELCIEDKTAVVHSTLGHGDYLKYGVMKTLFFEVIKKLWDRVDKIVYGPRSDLNFFKKDLLFQ